MTILSFLCFLTFLLESTEALTKPYMIKSICGQLVIIGYAYVPTILIFLIHTLVNNEKDLSRKNKALFLITPTICTIIALTNPWTGWFYSSIITPPIGIWQIQLQYNPNFGEYILVAYNLLIMVGITFYLLKIILKDYKSNVNSIIVMLFSTLCAIFINSIYFSNFIPGYNWGAISYLVIFIFIVISIFIFDAFDLKGMLNKYVIDEVNVGILYFDNDNKLNNINPAAKNLNLTDNDLRKSIEDIFKNNEKLINFYYDPKLSELEFIIDEKYYEINKTKPKKGNNYVGTVLTFNDITSRINEIKQKDLLIKEVHHRVKNNFQIILSLMNLDLRLNSNDLMDIIKDTRLRLNYMASLQEKLYSDNRSGINIKEYLVDIANEIFNMYNSKIVVEEDIESYIIDLNLAVSLGLILTEIINNTIKYAFSNENGKFYIKFKVKDNQGILDLYDNGKGLPEGFNFEDSTGLGMTVIKSVTAEISGEVEIVPDTGAHFKIKIPLEQG